MKEEDLKNNIEKLKGHRKHLSEEVLKLKRLVISLGQDCKRKDRKIIKLKEKLEVKEKCIG